MKYVTHMIYNLIRLNIIIRFNLSSLCSLNFIEVIISAILDCNIPVKFLENLLTSRVVYHHYVEYYNVDVELYWFLSLPLSTSFGARILELPGSQ